VTGGVNLGSSLNSNLHCNRYQIPSR